MTIQFIILKKFLINILPIEVIDNIELYDESHLNRYTLYEIKITVLYKNYKFMSESQFIESVKENMRTFAVLKKIHDSPELSCKLVIHMVNKVYICLRKLKFSPKLHKFRKEVLLKIIEFINDPTMKKLYYSDINNLEYLINKHTK